MTRQSEAFEGPELGNTSPLSRFFVDIIVRYIEQCVMVSNPVTDGIGCSGIQDLIPLLRHAAKIRNSP